MRNRDADHPERLISRGGGGGWVRQEMWDLLIRKLIVGGLILRKASV